MSREDVMSDNLTELLFGLFDPLYEFHCGFLRELEQRLALWEGRTNVLANDDQKRIGDLILSNLTMLQVMP